MGPRTGPRPASSMPRQTGGESADGLMDVAGASGEKSVVVVEGRRAGGIDE